MGQTVFKKVMSSDRLPSESGMQITNKGIIHFLSGCGRFMGCEPQWWLEEIEQDDPEEIKRQLLTKQNHLSYMMKNMVIWDKKENKVIDLLKHYKECVDSHTASQNEFSKMIDELLEELG